MENIGTNSHSVDFQGYMQRLALAKNENEVNFIVQELNAASDLHIKTMKEGENYESQVLSYLQELNKATDWVLTFLKQAK